MDGSSPRATVCYARSCVDVCVADWCCLVCWKTPGTLTPQRRLAADRCMSATFACCCRSGWPRSKSQSRTRKLSRGSMGAVAPKRVWKWGGRHQSGAKVGGAPIRRKAPEKFFLVVPLHFLALKAQLLVLMSASWWSVQFGQLLVCCSPTHGAPTTVTLTCSHT